MIAEYDNGAAVGVPSREYIYSGGALTAKIDATGTKYYHQDHLSNRLVTDSTGNTVEQLGHYPFGESWYNATNDKLWKVSANALGRGAGRLADLALGAHFAFAGFDGYEAYNACMAD